MNDFYHDHHRFDLQGTREKLNRMLSYAYEQWPGRATQARYYTVRERAGLAPQLILFWEKPDDSAYPVFGMNAGASQMFVQSWLESLPKTAAGKEPDTDGSTDIGVHVFNERWGFAGNSPYGIVVIEPVWLVFGK